MAAEDAARVADWIRWAVSGQVKLARTFDEEERGVQPEARPEDFMILLRYKKLMGVYARALEERGIPYEITGSRAFADSEDIREIGTMARALREPENPVYTVAVLRGIFFGVSDQQLWEFKKAGGRFDFLRKWGREPSASSNGIEWSEGGLYVAECLTVMREWWSWTRRYSPSVALEKIVNSSGLLSYLVSVEMGSSKAGNTLKVLEQVRGREVEGETTFSEAVRFLEELGADNDVEEMSLTPGRVDAVRLMNLHKAKGLEAPEVFLANPKGTKAHPPDRHVLRSKEGGS